MKPSKIKEAYFIFHNMQYSYYIIHGHTVLYFPTHSDSIPAHAVGSYLFTLLFVNKYENMHKYCKLVVTSLFNSPLWDSEMMCVKLKPL